MIVSLALTATVGIAVAGNDLITGQLRTDLPVVYNSGDYVVTYIATDKPGILGGYTNAWFGVFLSQFNGQTYSGQFSQVGLLTNNDGPHWFVYAEPGVTCLRGNANWYSGTLVIGCLGNTNDIVQMNVWHQVELVTYGQGYWIARVYDSNLNAYEVARINYAGTRLYRAESTTEEGYDSWWPSDPFLTARFYHWRPRYMDWNIGAFQFWPRSDGNNSTIYVNRSGFCPNAYGMNPNFNNDEDAWYVGMGGQQCSWLLFPSRHHYIPLVIK